MSSNYPPIHLVSDAFQASLNASPHPFVHLLLLLRQTNLLCQRDGRNSDHVAQTSCKLKHAADKMEKLDKVVVISECRQCADIFCVTLL